MQSYRILANRLLVLLDDHQAVLPPFASTSAPSSLAALGLSGDLGRNGDLEGGTGDTSELPAPLAGSPVERERLAEGRGPRAGDIGVVLNPLAPPPVSDSALVLPELECCCECECGGGGGGCSSRLGTRERTSCVVVLSRPVRREEGGELSERRREMGWLGERGMMGLEGGGGGGEEGGAPRRSGRPWCER